MVVNISEGIIGEFVTRILANEYDIRLTITRIATSYRVGIDGNDDDSEKFVDGFVFGWNLAHLQQMNG